MVNTFNRFIALAIIMLICYSQPTSVSSISSISSVSPSVFPSFPSLSPISGNWRMNSGAGYNTNISVTITGTQISFKYCNQQSYNYQVSGNRIKISGGASTKMMCKMIAPPTENELTTALLSAYTYSENGNSLVLRNSDRKIVASLTKEANSPSNPPVIPQPSVSIVGEWTATNVKGQSVSFAVTISATNLSYRYCNSKNMGYTLNGNRITFSNGISTLMACLNLNPTEQFVSSAFNSVRSYRVNNNVLSFLDQNGNTVITLQSGSAPITGTYIIGMINNVGTTELNKVQVTITDSAISFKYCNGKSFPYTKSGNTISIQSGISTMMYCSGLDPSESTVSQAFLDARTFRMDGNTLTFTGADGRTKVSLFKQN